MLVLTFKPAVRHAWSEDLERHVDFEGWQFIAHEKLFKKVTGLTTADFERLVSLGVFNSALMNDAVWKVRRYEDASLRYMGVRRHKGLDVGLFETTLTEEDFTATFQELSKS